MAIPENMKSKLNTQQYSVIWETDRMVYSLNRDFTDQIAMSRDDTPVNVMTQYYPQTVHSHSFYEIEYILSGSGVQHINGVDYPVKKGDVIFLVPNDRHTYGPDPGIEEFLILNCEFREIPVGHEEKISAMPMILSMSPRSTMEIDAIFAKMEKESLEKETGYEDFLSAYLNLILAILYRESRTQISGKPAPAANIMKVLEYIEERRMRVTMKDCADHLSYSTSYFSRIFKESVGMTLTKYLNDRKIQMAMTLLTETDQPVDAVMEKSGFEHRKSFYTLFKKYTEMTPNEFRKHSRKKGVVAKEK